MRCFNFYFIFTKIDQYKALFNVINYIFYLYNSYIYKKNNNNTFVNEGKFISKLFKGELFSIIKEDNPEFKYKNIFSLR